VLFEVLTAVNTTTTVFWDVTPCSLIESYESQHSLLNIQNVLKPVWAFHLCEAPRGTPRVEEPVNRAALIESPAVRIKPQLVRVQFTTQRNKVKDSGFQEFTAKSV
jgi:hypothetical protein